MVILPIWSMGSARKRRDASGRLEEELNVSERESADDALFATKLVGYLVIGSALMGLAYCLLRSSPVRQPSSSYDSVPYVSP